MTRFDPFRPAGCRCPGVADLVRAELEGRQLPPCPAHQPEAVQAQAEAERQRAIAALAAPPSTPAPAPPAEHPTETLKATVERLLRTPRTPPAAPTADPRAQIPLNATADEWEAHLGLNDQE